MQTLFTQEKQQMYGSLFLKYRPGCYWYQFAVMARVIVLSAGT